MIENKRSITSFTNILDSVQEYDDDYLKDFIKNYLLTHKHVRCNALSHAFISQEYYITSSRHLDFELKKAFNRKFGRVLKYFMDEGIIKKYNSKVYVRVDFGKNS